MNELGHPLDTPMTRAARYRARADEMRKRAAAIGLADIRASFLEVAETYDALAQTIEDIAARQAHSDPFCGGGA